MSEMSDEEFIADWRGFLADANGVNGEPPPPMALAEYLLAGIPKILDRLERANASGLRGIKLLRFAEWWEQRFVFGVLTVENSDIFTIHEQYDDECGDPAWRVAASGTADHVAAEAVRLWREEQGE